jgi:hypothetical protein
LIFQMLTVVLVEKTKYMTVERINSLKQNKIRHLKIKNYKFVRAEKILTKHTLWYNFF